MQIKFWLRAHELIIVIILEVLTQLDLPFLFVSMKPYGCRDTRGTLFVCLYLFV